MPVYNAGQLLLQAGFSFCFCLLLWLTGSIVLSVVRSTGEKEDRYAAVFYRMLSGILVLVLLYSVYKTSFITINILLVPAAFFYIRVKKTNLRVSVKKIPWQLVAEIFLLCGLFCLLFNFLPESEYKQKDSFFYLEIARSLNRTGQENLHQHYNLLDARYHGVEAYHYMELWLNAFQLNFTSKLLPGIQTFRIVTYTTLSVAFMLGLFHCYRVITGGRPGIWGKLVCVSFLFFMPDLFSILPPFITKYLLFNFENNYLERPNFRVIYLFLIPVLIRLYQKRIDKTFLFFLFCLCLLSPLVFLVLLPAAFLCFVIYPKRGDFSGNGLVAKKDLVLFFLLAAAYLLFYVLFSVRKVQMSFHVDIHSIFTFYKRSWKYVLLTISTTLLYIAALCTIGWLIFKSVSVKERTGFFRANKPVVVFAVTVIGCSVILSRAFDSIENFYQVAYLGYMMSALFLFVLLVLLSRKGIFPAVLAVLLCTGGYIVSKYQNRQTAFVNIFLQNGPGCYEGKPYSATYVKAVIGFMQSVGPVAGAYMADSNYYRDLYYTLHNPVVYHLPITYIISNNLPANTDYCVSDTNAVYCGTGNKNGERNAYLANGIARSYFHNGFLPGSDMPDRLGRFIDTCHLKYLIITKGIVIDAALAARVSGSFTDASTGERFLILNTAAL